jgi:hypothetical protein
MMLSCTLMGFKFSAGSASALAAWSPISAKRGWGRGSVPDFGQIGDGGPSPVTVPGDHSGQIGDGDGPGERSRPRANGDGDGAGGRGVRARAALTGRLRGLSGPGSLSELPASDSSNGPWSGTPAGSGSLSPLEGQDEAAGGEPGRRPAGVALWQWQSTGRASALPPPTSLNFSAIRRRRRRAAGAKAPRPASALRLAGGATSKAAEGGRAGRRTAI